MNNKSINSLKKAGLFTCLFLLSQFLKAQEVWFTSQSQRDAYHQTTTLQLFQARQTLQENKEPQSYYILTLSEVLELLITEDENLFEKYEDSFIERIDALKEEEVTAVILHTQAELRLQWAFVYLKFGHELDAAWSIRLANQLVQECKKKFSNYKTIQKPSGLLEIMLGSVPEKFQWVLSLLNMQGSVETGLKELRNISNQNQELSFETQLLYHLIQGFMLQKTNEAIAGMEQLIATNPNNPLLLYLAAAVAIKNSESEKALKFLQHFEKMEIDIPMPYSQYLMGEVQLHKGNFAKSATAYHEFLNQYKGLNYRKDAYFKIGLCYWLTYDTAQTIKYFSLAKQKGKEATEADKYAARSLSEGNYPNIKLSKVRFLTDGGYYKEARLLVKSIEEKEFTALKEKVEFAYRKARLNHKLEILEQAKKDYLNTIQLANKNNWYFAPNACLQLGYIFQQENNTTEARKYFEKALSYKRHEYKNSIDSKAKSALTQLNKKSKS